MKAVSIRHDIVHRNGKSLKGDCHKLSTKIVLQLVQQVDAAVQQLSGIERIRFDDGVLLFNLPPSAKTLGGLYKAIFNRLGDENGLNFYVKTLAGLSSDSSLKTISNAFLQSQEAASLNQMSDAQFVTLMYQNALGRAPDAAGFQHHLNTLAHGNSRADVALEFSSSTEQLTLLGQFTNAGIFSPVADPLLG